MENNPYFKAWLTYIGRLMKSYQSLSNAVEELQSIYPIDKTALENTRQMFDETSITLHEALERFYLARGVEYYRMTHDERRLLWLDGYWSQRSNAQDRE